jgi:hypothetical protein
MLETLDISRGMGALDLLIFQTFGKIFPLGLKSTSPILLGKE